VSALARTLFDVDPVVRLIEDVPVDWAGLARTSDPDTSRAAARTIGKGTETAVMAAHCKGVFYSWAGLTDDELAEIMDGWHPPTVKSARSRLSRRGLLVDSGERRLSSRGRAQIVWQVAP